jgi:hypothetical protein
MRKLDLGALVPLIAILIVLLAAWIGLFGPVGAIGDKERAGLVKFLYDWQQIISGVLALAAAGVAAWLVWGQLKEASRQASAAERQLLLLTDDLIARRIADIHSLKARIFSLVDIINAVDFNDRRTDHQHSILHEIRERIDAIEAGAHPGMLTPPALDAVNVYCDLARLVQYGVEALIEDTQRSDPAFDLSGKRAALVRQVSEGKKAMGEGRRAADRARELLALDRQQLEKRQAELAQFTRS